MLHQALQQAFHAAEEALGTVKKRRNPGWFKMNQVALQKLIVERNTLAAEIKKQLQRMNQLREAETLLMMNVSGVGSKFVRRFRNYG